MGKLKMFRSRIVISANAALMGALLVIAPFGAYVVAADPITNTISGTFTNNENQPISNATVCFVDRAGDYDNVTTDSDGNYVATVLPAVYTASLCNYTQGQQNINLDESTFIVDATAGNVTQNFKFDDSAITVQVVDASGSPVNEALVDARTTGGSTTLLVGNSATYVAGPGTHSANYTDATGSAVIPVLNGLIYNVCATPSGGQPACQTITPSGPTTITLTIPVTNTMTGVLTDSDGQPVPNAGICFTAANGDYGTTTTDATGSFTANVMPGAYEATLCYYQQGLVALDLEPDGTYTWDASQGNVTRDLKLNTASLTATFKDEHGDPISDSIVNAIATGGSTTLVVGQAIAYTPANSTHAAAYTDQNGVATIQIIKGLTYNVCGTLNGGEQVCSPLESTGGDATITLQQASTVPAIPSMTAASSPTNQKPVVTWDAGSDASSAPTSSYNVYRAGVLIGTTAAKTYTDTSVTSNGSYTYAISAVSSAGVESAQSSTKTVIYDKTAPSISYSVSAAPNTNGWNSTNVVVTFACSDADSGVQTCTSPVTVSNEGANQVITGTATDKAGNTATITATINLDKTLPTIGYTATPSANADGWNNSNVTVAFTCADTLATIASCSNSQTINSEGTSNIATGTATDKAGNTTSVTTPAIKVDKTAPSLTGAAVSAGTITNGQSTNFNVSVADSLSGVKRGEYFVGTDPGQGNATALTLSGGTLSTTLNGLTPGVKTISYRAQDVAGNWTSVQTVQVTVKPQAPTGLAAVTTTKTAPALTWNSVSGANHYDIYRDGTKVASSNTASFTDSTAPVNASHVYYIVAVTADNVSSANSGSVTVVYDTTAPTIATPTVASSLLLVSGSQTIGATVSDALSGVAAGEYYLTTTNTAPTATPGTGTAMTYSGGKLSASYTSSGSGSHYAWMRVKDAAGNWSGFVSTSYTEVL